MELSAGKRPQRRAWMQKVLQAQSQRAPEELDAARARIESARQHEVCARKCKAVKGRAVRSRALAAEGLRQMAEVEAPEEYAAVQERWMSAQVLSKARQQKKCKRLGRTRRRRSRSRDRGDASSGASDSGDAAAIVLREASDSEEDAMVEAAGLVGASSAMSMAAVGAEGLAVAAAPAPPGPPGAPAPARGGGAQSAVSALLRQLTREPKDSGECAAKFQLYEGYAVEVEGMRSTLLEFHKESRPALPTAIAMDMDRQVRGIDCEDAMRIPDRSREWFVYHMMCQAERNNLKMAGILDGMEKKLKFLASNDQSECPVCLDDFGEGSKAPETLSCCHKVCRECWHHWSRVMHGRPFCPYCRHEDFLGAVATRASRGESSGSESET